MSLKTESVLFDLDGVLIKSHAVWLRVMQDASRHFGGREVTLEEFTPLFGQGTRADIEIFGLKCTPDELNAYFFENFDRCSAGGGIWVDPEAAPALSKLRKSGIKLAIVTNTMQRLAVSLLKNASLLQFFDAIATADQVPRAKPAPDMLDLALKRLGCGRQSAWMIGDSKFDRDAAGAAGVRFIGYRQPGDIRIDRLSSLPGAVGAEVPYPDFIQTVNSEKEMAEESRKTL